MTTRRLAAWVAMLAMALQALWPLIAQAKPRSSTLVPVCTVDGVTHHFELKRGDTPLEKRTTAQHEHCMFCTFGAPALASVRPGLHAAAVPEPVPPAPLLQPAASRSFPSARPRGPPAIS